MAFAAVASSPVSRNIASSSIAPFPQQQPWQESGSRVSSLSMHTGLSLPSLKISLCAGGHGDDKGKPVCRTGRCRCFSGRSRSDAIARNDLSLTNQERFPNIHDSPASPSAARRPEDWLEESVDEIVRHLQEAPFLQLIYDNQGRLKTERQRVSSSGGAGKSERWNTLKGGLSTAQPDGVVLVQRLDGNASDGHDDCLPLSQEQGYQLPQHLRAGSNDGTDFWGLLFLARTAACSACYVLQTTRVCSSLGICTRFCVTKARCFGPSVDKQIENLWLASQ